MDEKGSIEFVLGSCGGVSAEELGYWATIVENTANEFCKDPECKRIQFKIDSKRNVRIVAPQYEDVFCLIQSSKMHEDEMPKLIQEAFHSIITAFIVKRHRKYEN